MKNIPEQIFKAYDIRGIYPTELNEELIYKIGRAYGLLRFKELGEDKKITIVVGHDMRISSPSLVKKLKQGLLDQGINVVDIGLTSTPTFYFAVAKFGYDGGMLVSASHNPKEYNGIKIVRQRSTPLGENTGMEELRDLVKNDVFVTNKEKGEEIKREDILKAEVEVAKQFADLSKIKPMKIVLDTANAMGILYLEELFKDLPQIELIKINDKLDGTFPAHQADPLQEETLVDLKKKVIEKNADLGIATDGDGDRIFYIDNEGNRIDPAIMRGVVAQTFLKDNPGSVICFDIRPGKITEDLILEAGGIPSVTRVGHSFIKKQMLETGAVFGGESSGHFFVKFPDGVYESPMIATLRFLRVMSESGKSFADFVRPLNKYYHSGEINFKVKDKTMILDNLKEKFADKITQEFDGVSFDLGDWWFNVRPSNTEPLLRLNLEARTGELMEEKLGEIRELINSN